MPKRSLKTPRQKENSHLRLRSYRACHECRRRKRKCDGQLPCSSCAGYGYCCEFEAIRPSENETLQSSNENNNSSPAEDPSTSSKGRLLATNDTASRGPLPANISPVTVVSGAKDRVASAHSAAALPLTLGRDLKDTAPPRLHSFAWNLGVGTERRNNYVSKASTYITKEECLTFSQIYFDFVHPTFAILDQSSFLEKAQSDWSSLQSNPSFESVVCGVVALGSFFSSHSHPHESDLFNQCTSILDMANLELVTPMNVELMAGWILRTIYLRLTTRPHMSCHASHTAMHNAEFLCLHRDMIVENKIETEDSSPLLAARKELHRRLFWTAWSLNVILATEYGMTPVNLPFITCQLPSDDQYTHSEQLVQLAQILHNSYHKTATEPHWQNLETYVKQIANISSASALLSVFKADICLCLLRQSLRVSKQIDESVASDIAHVIQSAFAKIRSLIEHRLPWWNVATVPFQTICICLYLNNLPMLSLLPQAMELLQIESDVFNSHLTREALSTARHLITASQENEASKKHQRDLALNIDGSVGLSTNPIFFFDNTESNNFDDWLLSF